MSHNGNNVESEIKRKVLCLHRGSDGVLDVLITTNNLNRFTEWLTDCKQFYAKLHSLARENDVEDFLLWRESPFSEFW